MSKLTPNETTVTAGKSCDTCAYERSSSCHFPEPQDGSAPPFIVTAACPNPFNGGRICMQFRRARNAGGQ